MLGVIQALIVSIGDLVILKATVESPVLFVSIAVFSSLVFNSIIHVCNVEIRVKPLQLSC